MRGLYRIANVHYDDDIGYEMASSMVVGFVCSVAPAHISTMHTMTSWGCLSASTEQNDLLRIVAIGAG